MHIAAEEIELRNDDRRTFLAGTVQSLCERRAMILAVLAALNLGERLRESVALRLGKASQGFLLSSRPRPERPCFAVETRMYPMAGFILPPLKLFDMIM